MRLLFFTLLFSVTLASIGCNSDLRCRRETALLRAEYLDLEDKYYALLSQTGTEANATVASNEVVVENTHPVIYGSGVVPTPVVPAPVVQPSIGQPSVVYENYSPSQPEIIYYDQTYGQTNQFPTHGQPYEPINGLTTPYTPQPTYAPVPTPVTPETAAGSGSVERPSAETLLVDPELPEKPPFDSPVPSTPNNSQETLPAPDSSLNDEANGFDFEIDNTQEVGHEIKIELSSPITEVVINKTVSQGKNFDRLAGDDGIELLIQPKSASGAVIDEAGNLTINLIDSAASQGQRRIGQWTFLKEEAELFFAEDEFDNRGILLDLQWDKIIPTNKRLTVYVRFETPEGRIMETTSDIIIDPPASSMTKEQFDGSQFVTIPRDQNVKDTPQDQGWYQSQIRRNRRRGSRDSRDSIQSNESSTSYQDTEWIRSQRSSEAGFNNRPIGRNLSQPRWRPAR
jgi:hypothetical protein